MCKGIVEEHGGRIWATSPGEGQGTTFSFTLPTAPEHHTPVLLVADLCNNARRHPERSYVGDTTETALLKLAERAAARRLRVYR